MPPEVTTEFVGATVFDTAGTGDAVDATALLIIGSGCWSVNTGVGVVVCASDGLETVVTGNAVNVTALVADFTCLVVAKVLLVMDFVFGEPIVPPVTLRPAYAKYKRCFTWFYVYFLKTPTLIHKTLTHAALTHCKYSFFFNTCSS